MGSNIVHIGTHSLDAQGRLLEQYKGLSDPQNIIDAFAQQIQAIEDALYQLFTQRWIKTAVGVQLDEIGAIVGIARTSSDDDIYRLEIFAKVVKNVSEGSTEDLISVYKYVTGANIVIFQDIYPANIYIQSDGSLLSGFSNPNPVFDLVQQSASAGVEISYLGLFDGSNAFSFDGNLETGSGFGSILNPSAGGKFAHLIQRNDPFAFDGDDTTTKGFGSCKGVDPIIGGNFVSI
jgi:hypothetical protein